MFDPTLLEKYLIPFGSQVEIAGVKMPTDEGMGFIVLDNNLNSLPIPRNGYEFKTSFLRSICYSVSIIKDGEQTSTLTLPISKIRGHPQIPALEIWRLSSLIPYVRGRITALPAQARAWKPRPAKECETREEKVANLFKAISEKAQSERDAYDINKIPKELRDLDDTFTYFFENSGELNINTIKSLLGAEDYLSFCSILYTEKATIRYLSQLVARYQALMSYISLTRQTDFQYAISSE